VPLGADLGETQHMCAFAVRALLLSWLRSHGPKISGAAEEIKAQILLVLLGRTQSNKRQPIPLDIARPRLLEFLGPEKPQDKIVVRVKSALFPSLRADSPLSRVVASLTEQANRQPRTKLLAGF
jgi:hypothetical protein